MNTLNNKTNNNNELCECKKPLYAETNDDRLFCILFKVKRI